MAQLTSKELSAIEDQLGAEKLLVTKFKAYAQSCQDVYKRQVVFQSGMKSL